MNWFKRAQSKLFQYFGQCDRVRCDQVGEDNWQKMIRNHVKVTWEELINNCDIDPLLSDDESANDFIRDNMRADPGTYLAKSEWGNSKCYYIMTHGFEFIFVRV